MAGTRPYREAARDELETIERRRRGLGISQVALCDRAGLSERTYRRMLRSGVAFPRRLMALRMALRELEKMRRQQRRLFAIEGAAT